MFNQIPEKQMHYVRWLLTIGWAVLIGSMFYDPFTTQLTDVSNLWSPFRIGTDCIQFQGACLQPTPYDMGARIFWGMIIPSSIVLIFLFGHEVWRRICPLSFIAQLPRALGLQHKRLTIKSTGNFAYEPVKVAKDSWLGRNYLYLQFSLLFLGLNIRLLFVNSDCLALGIYLVSTILLAMAVNYWYGGKSWCHYVCPMAPVQMVYTGPRGLLGSKAHQEKKNLTQSMCRTVDGAGKEKSACVSCKSSCLDIDIEKSYWEEIHQPDRKLLYYGYFGLIVGFYLYFFLYSGNASFFAVGSWSEMSQLETLFNPGFYIGNQVIPIPKIVAVPLTLSGCTGLSYVFGLLIERAYKHNVKPSNTTKGQRSIFKTFTKVQHRIFTACTFLSFNALFFLGIYPSFTWLSAPVEQVLTWMVVIASSAWLYRTLKRSAGQYTRESRVNSLRRSLDQLAIDFPNVLEGRSLEELTAEEVYVLGKILPDLMRDKDILEEALRQEEASNKKAKKDTDRSVQRETLEKISQALESKKLESGKIEAPALPPPRPSSVQVELYSVVNLEIVEKEFLFLDNLLKELLGPIGPLLLRHTAPQASSLQELVQKLNAHIPLEKLAEFQCKTIPILQKSTVQPGGKKPQLSIVSTESSR
jgi:polyferredoxin/heme exporter protein D